MMEVDGDFDVTSFADEAFTVAVAAEPQSTQKDVRKRGRKDCFDVNVENRITLTVAHCTDAKTGSEVPMGRVCAEFVFVASTNHQLSFNSSD